VITDKWYFQIITSDFIVDLAKPAVIVTIIGFMIYAAVKPRIQASDKVEV